MVLAYLTFFTGISISVVAIYYSVLGLAAIFAAAVVPIVIMGTTLEVSKLVTAWWLKANWNRAPWSIKIYLTIAVIILMVITSMGIFGFLSKAHTDQVIPLGDTVAQVAFVDEKINNEREIIANSRSLIKQLDDAVIGIQSGEGREIRSRDGTTRIENPAERALQVRRAQAQDRAALTSTIGEAQSRIVKLQEERAPVAGKLRAVEAEVGPIKYIAKLIYGDNPDQNILEKAVVWVIVIIVFVFDPLAVLLLLASQMSFQWAKKEEQDELVQEDIHPEETTTTTTTPADYKAGSIDHGGGKQSSATAALQITIDQVEEANRKIAEIDQDTILHTILPTISTDETVVDIDESTNIDDSELDSDYFDKFCSIEKNAIHKWKDENPQGSIKRNRKLLEEGFITELPWQGYIDDLNEEKYRQIANTYAPQQVRIKPDFTEVIEPAGYIQNSEQSEGTIWKKIQEKKNDQ